MTSIILSVGDELVLGQTVDTNSAWISQKLAAIGCAVVAHMTVGDDQPGIELAINKSIGRCDYLIISGGLGPTEDDLTRQAIAKVMNVALEESAEWMAQLDTYFKNRGRPMPEKNRIQAMIPVGAKMIFNHAGTASGISARVQDLGFRVQQMQADEPPSSLNPEPRTLNPLNLFAVPGVPKEMKAMVERNVLPVIAKESGGAVILQRTLHTFGLGESALAEKLGDLMRRDLNPSVGTTVANGVVSLRVNARFASLDEATTQLEATCDACRASLGELIYGEDGRTIAQVVNAMLAERKQTLTTAESCTGGLLGAMITDVPGSSAIFKMGFITYSNLAKYERLGVSTEVINVYGAVSENVVAAMSKNARRLAKATYALAISGIAGPDGGSPTKPVGTVCIALCFDKDAPPLTRTFNFLGDREMIRDRSAKMALTMLRFHLLGQPLPF